MINQLIKAKDENKSLQEMINNATASFKRRSISIKDEQVSKVNTFTCKPCITLGPNNIVTNLLNIISKYNIVNDNDNRTELVEKVTKEFKKVDTDKDRKKYREVKYVERWLENKYQELNYKMGSSTKFNEEISKEFDKIDILSDCIKKYSPNPDIEAEANEIMEEFFIRKGISHLNAKRMAYERIKMLDEKTENLYNHITRIRGIIYGLLKHGDSKEEILNENHSEYKNILRTISASSPLNNSNYIY